MIKINTLMLHSFTHRLLQVMDTETLTDLKNFVTGQDYDASDDFESYTVNVTRDLTSDHDNWPVKNFIKKYLLKYFYEDGNISTNLSRMAPYSYVSEHSDYNANKFGDQQDDIIKLQVPIITNPGAGLMWRETDPKKFQVQHPNLSSYYSVSLPSACCSLVEGGIYIMNNVRTHSSVNFSSEYRYWLTCRWHVLSLRDFELIA